MRRNIKKKLISRVCLLLFLGSILFIFRQYPIKEIIPFHLYLIQTGSMKPEIQIGEMVIVKKKQDYQEGDIITYQVNHSYFVTHRIIEKTEEGFFTKGDFNNTKDEKIIKKEEIQGKVILHSKVLGMLFHYRLAMIAILVLLLIISEMERRAKAGASENKKSKTAEKSRRKERKSKRRKI